MITLDSVCKNFGDLRAVSDVSFSATPGQIFGLIGPNGAGKSTTIRMIMNILSPDSGAILFDGRPITEEDKDRIGYLPEERGLYKKVKVIEMLTYLADLKGVSATDSIKRIEYWLDRFELMDWKERKIEELSKGMAQKVQFIAAVAHDPELCFFDEPFSGLDPVSSDLLLESILELGRKGKTILFSTHIMENAEKVCNNIFLINKGREVVSGPISDIKSRYGSRSVIVEYDGNGEFIQDLPFVSNVLRFPRWIEVELADGNKFDALLREIAPRLSVRRFEVVAPSLHKIFVNLVGGKNTTMGEGVL